MLGDPRTLAKTHIMGARQHIGYLHSIGEARAANALNLLFVDAQTLLENLEGADALIAHLRDRVKMLEAEVKRLSAAPWGPEEWRGHPLPTNENVEGA